MIIKELKIYNFGKIKDKVIRFDDSINVIFGKNESGKTTIITFIRFMLFGGQGRINPTKDYFPLDLSNPSGEIVISHMGKEYLIVRNGVKKKGSYATVTCFDDGEVLSGDKAENFISDMVGMSEEMFSSTIYVKDISESISLAKSEILERLDNLSSSGDELISFEKIINSLDDEKLSITSTKRKGAVIPKLMSELEAIDFRIEEKNKKVSLIEITKSNLEKTVQEEKEVSLLIESGEGNGEGNVVELNERFIDINNQITDLEKNIPSSLFGLDQRIIDECLKLEKNFKNNIKYLVYGFLFILCVLSIFIAYKPVVVSSFCVLVSLAYTLYLFSVKNKLKDILKKFDAKGYDDLISKFEFFCEQTKKLHSLKEKRDVISENIKNLKEILENKKNILKNNMERALEINAQKNRLEAELEGLWLCEEELKTLECEKKNIKESLEKYSEYVKIIEDTKEMITKAYEKMKKDFSPAISQKAGEVFSFVTEKADEKVVISDELALSLRRQDGFYSTSNMSRSTIDLLYFSFRIAVIEAIAKETGILIFDEAFIRYDKDRLKKVYSYLKSVNHQIILTVFSDFEKEFIKEQCDYNLIEL